MRAPASRRAYGRAGRRRDSRERRGDCSAAPPALRRRCSRSRCTARARLPSASPAGALPAPAQLPRRHRYRRRGSMRGLWRCALGHEGRRRRCGPNQVSVSDVAMKTTAAPVVSRVRKLPAPLLPKMVVLAPPNTASMSAPLPACRRTFAGKNDAGEHVNDRHQNPHSFSFQPRNAMIRLNDSASSWRRRRARRRCRAEPSACRCCRP